MDENITYRDLNENEELTNRILTMSEELIEFLKIKIDIINGIIPTKYVQEYKVTFDYIYSTIELDYYDLFIGDIYPYQLPNINYYRKKGGKTIIDNLLSFQELMMKTYSFETMTDMNGITTFYSIEENNKYLEEFMNKFDELLRITKDIMKDQKKYFYNQYRNSTLLSLRKTDGCYDVSNLVGEFFNI